MAVTDSFLQQYVETISPRTPTVVKYWTGACAQAEAGPSLWVATYHVLSVERRQDTLIVAAAVTSVAEQGESHSKANQFVVRPRVQTDTLHFRVVQNPPGQFIVCGFSLENVDLGAFGLPSNVVYEQGETALSLRRRADSLREPNPQRPRSP
jgi:hypothetical protein